MIETQIKNGFERKEIPFPKLMRGLRTGTIYLAMSQRGSVYGPQVQTVVMATSHNNNQNFGERAVYSLEWLEDFHGEVIIRNKNA